ncbi:hypothetical protein QJS10_CPA03g00304 [Acorus calamus]|uniref:Adipose-regulatory protein n=1 Tax=Acorus calamus TaxID=4465 RepID=A0AAV9F5Y1_ACOCL|nr:hypothetical protein QJS10_CPA03g00304 [Acorus calamus]
MEEQPKDVEDDVFFDAPDEFPPYDPDEAVEESEVTVDSSLPASIPPSDKLRRRHSVRIDALRRSFTAADDSPSTSEFTQLSDVIGPKERPRVVEEESNPVEQFPPSNVLDYLVGFLIKAIGFQMGLLFSFITFPVWLVSNSLMMILNPFGTLKNVKEATFSMFSRILDRLGTPLRGQPPIGEFVARFGWGFFWSFYVGFVLAGSLVLAFLLGWVLIRGVVEEPVRITEMLNFDYSEASPVALVPITSCEGVFCGGGNCGGVDGLGARSGKRVIPLNQKLHLTVSLTLPESEYNQRLGVFQVRVEFLSSNGKVLVSSSQPCMLHFKSTPIQLIQTFLKSVPLLAGYSSESQTLNLKMSGIAEKAVPTACLRIILKQRAEFINGGGLPEIYAAWITLESELPFIKRVIWYWRRTVFMWISMSLFVVELIFIMVCCRPFVIPRERSRDSSVTM